VPSRYLRSNDRGKPKQEAPTTLTLLGTDQQQTENRSKPQRRADSQTAGRPERG
jgi:hypothetical protein